MRTLWTQRRVIMGLISAATITACANSPDYLESRPPPAIETYPPVPAATDQIFGPETTDTETINTETLDPATPKAEATDTDANLIHKDGVVVPIPANLAETPPANSTIKQSENKKE